MSNMMHACIHAYIHTYIQTSIHRYIHTYIDTYIIVVNFDALAQASDIQIERRQVAGKRYSNRKETSCVPLLNAGFEPGVPDTKSPAELMLADKLTELSRITLKNLNSTAHPYDQRAFSPLDPTVSWLSHLALAIFISVVVNFDALAQASEIQIERSQVVFLCWMQDLNPGSQTPNRHTYMFVVVNFDALAQASDIRI